MCNLKLCCALFLALALVVSASCGKEPEEVSTTPKIEFVSISPEQVVEYQDAVVIVIKYLDGDGDLGENNPSAKNLFVKDTRNNVSYSYRISQLAPDSANIAIEGLLNIDLANTAVIGSGNSEAVTFEVSVTDRAGHESNTVTTSPITVSKP
ncbi:MAG: hypothetical protein SFW35_12825 [Chitinophagales bacterium]|nr:hypothetical protein [Chitinophagales bacterium]